MIDVRIKKELEHFTLDLEFSFNKGILVLQGESGAGKTTVLDCIAGLRHPELGKIRVNERTFYSSDEKISLPVSERKVGYVFQNYALFPHMSIRKNVYYGAKSHNNRENAELERVMDLFRITAIAHKYPSEISGGEKQRVALARAMATNPEILLLDEPFSALDQKTREIVYEEFLEYRERLNITAILVTHSEIEAARLGDHILHME